MGYPISVPFSEHCGWRYVRRENGTGTLKFLAANKSIIYSIINIRLIRGGPTGYAADRLTGVPTMPSYGHFVCVLS
jgi:hypothetical protein